MSPQARIVRGLVVILAAFVLDAAIGPDLAVAGIRPDLTLAALVPTCLMAGASGAAWLGLFAGALQGAFAATSFGSFAATRSVTGWGLGLIEERLFREHLVVAGAAEFAAVLVSDTLFYIVSPLPMPLRFAGQTLARSTYNMLIVVMLTMLLRPMYRHRD